MDPGAPQGLVGVDVPHAGNRALVEQSRLDRGAPAREPLCKPTAAERSLDRTDTFAREARRHGGGLERLNEPRIENRYALEPTTDKERRELPAHGFDLGQLRHGSSLAALVRALHSIVSRMIARWGGSSLPIVYAARTSSATPSAASGDRA